MNLYELRTELVEVGTKYSTSTKQPCHEGMKSPVFYLFLESKQKCLGKQIYSLNSMFDS